MASISNLGIGAGFDTQAILEQLSVAEQQRLTPYTSRQNSYQSKISAWGTISSALTTFQTSVKSLTESAFNTFTLSTNKAFSATASSSATAGVHQVIVERLASAHTITSKGYTDADADLGGETDGRTVTLTQKNGEKIEVALDDDQTSLNDIAKAINRKGGDIKATVVHSSDGYRLKLVSTKTGTDGAISVSVSGDDKLQDAIGFDATKPDANPNMIQTTEPLDALLTVDGIKYTRSENKITDIIDGVTLTLSAVSENQQEGEMLSLTQDPSAVKKAVQEFVKNYNDLISKTSSASKWVANDTSSLSDEEVATPNAKNGALMGDSTLRGMVSTLRREVNQVYGKDEISALNDLGITIDAESGKMTLSESKLDSAIDDYPDQVRNLFIGTEENPGLAVTLKESITEYLGDPDEKVDGIIKDTTKGLNDQLKQVKNQIEKTQKLIDNQVEQYRKQFQNLDKVMNSLTGTNRALTSMLAQFS